ncbi:MAG: adenylate/guanylate cyclase domain-containing protein, partial [Flavobacteriales bacterium]|nr:adenylate/guanylate cyclase domain-containing protein [Flavobacteriales bacterium]
ELRVAMGSCFDALGVLDSALYVLLQAARWSERGCTGELPFRVALNLGAVYLSLGEFARTDSVCREALEQAAAGGGSVHETDLLFNKAVAMANMGDLSGSEQEFRKLERLAGERDQPDLEIEAMLNRAVLMGMQDHELEAERVLRNALERCREIDCAVEAMILRNLAAAIGEQGRHAEGLPYMDTALQLVQGTGDLQVELEIVAGQAEFLHQLGEHQLAWDKRKLLEDLQDSLLNVEKVRAVSELQEQYQTERNLRQIKELEVDKLDGELRQAQLQRTRNIYLFSGIAVVFLAVGLWSRLRYVHRSRAAIQHEKDISEGLLHNILPEEVAAELKAKGEAEARLIDHVTVLFTDFKGFTALSEVLTPKELVKDLHECFSAFDAIMEKHGLEKIKTIGDAYMAAGGLPVENTTHAVDAIRAALEMRNFVEAGKARKITAGLPYFEVRIGIHTGPVVAGIVGVKKF